MTNRADACRFCRNWPHYGRSGVCPECCVRRVAATANFAYTFTFHMTVGSYSKSGVKVEGK